MWEWTNWEVDEGSQGRLMNDGKEELRSADTGANAKNVIFQASSLKEGQLAGKVSGIF